MAENAKLLSTDLADKLRIEILTEHMRQGEKLTEQVLCQRFGVSRTPIREALKNLETEGLVEMIPNRGAFVIGLLESDLKDLFILRMQSEMQAVRWAAIRRTAAELEEIEESLDFMRFYTERNDTKRMHAINAGFHKRIAMACHNRILIENLSRIRNYIRYSARIMPYKEADLATLLKEHTAIFAAFRAGDPEASAEAMQLHITNSQIRANLGG